MKQETALDILKTGKSIFLTGSAGTGKTYLLNQYIQYLKERKIAPSVVAPTGIAASHLDGSTIHSFFGLGIRDFIDDYFLDSLLQKKYLNDRFSKLKILIIDEVSMISPEIFSAMDKILKSFKFTDEPFGGVQVILSGDFFQLPPVSKIRKEKRFAWQAPAWRDLNLKTCYLEENFRQGEDKLIEILDDIRSGEISEQSYDIFKSRYQKDLDINFRPTKLYTHNIDVDRINNKELESLEGGLRIFEYTSSGTKKNIDKIFKSSLLLENMRLKKDAVVLFIKNNYEKGYINGTTGVVVDFDEEDGLPIVEIFSGRRIKASPED
jgi:ATP-dependent DNA helicase PIF1